MVTWLDSLRGTPSVGFFVSFLPDQSPQKGYPCLLLGMEAWLHVAGGTGEG